MLESIKRVLVSYIVKFLPETSFFGFKRFLYRQIGHEIGKNVRICSSAKIIGNGTLVIGDNTWIGPKCFISVSSTIVIGKDVDLAPLVYIGTGTHELYDKPHKIAGTGKNIDIIIGDGCWLGARSTILAGVIIEKMCMVAAGSLVNKNIIEFKMVAGVPAKIIKDLRNDVE